MSTRFCIFCHSACVIQHLASAVGTFGRVLECWDRQTREYVAIKVVRSIRKYRNAAMIEVDVLQHLAKNDKGDSHCVQIRSWFDYRNHICIVSIPITVFIGSYSIVSLFFYCIL